MKDESYVVNISIEQRDWVVHRLNIHGDKCGLLQEFVGRHLSNQGISLHLHVVGQILQTSERGRKRPTTGQRMKKQNSVRMRGIALEQNQWTYQFSSQCRRRKGWLMTHACTWFVCNTRRRVRQDANRLLLEANMFKRFDSRTTFGQPTCQCPTSDRKCSEKEKGEEKRGSSFCGKICYFGLSRPWTAVKIWLITCQGWTCRVGREFLFPK